MQKTLTFAFTDNWQLTTYSPPISNQHSAISIHVESVMRIDRAISGSRLWIMTLAGALMFCAPLPGQDQPPATQLGELTRGGRLRARSRSMAFMCAIPRGRSINGRWPSAWRA